MKAIRDEANMKLTGIAIGEKKKQVEIAKNMLKEGLNIEIIKKVTGLDEEEIRKLVK